MKAKQQLVEGSATRTQSSEAKLDSSCKVDKRKEADLLRRAEPRLRHSL